MGEHDVTTLHRLRGIVDDLVKRAGSDPPGIVNDAIGQLDVAIEELGVTLEELHEQNDELASARTQLEAEHRYYEELFDLAPDAYLLTDEQGIVHGANRAAVRLLATPRDRVVGHPLASFVPVDERPPFRDGLRRAVRERSTDDWSFALTPRDHASVVVAAHVTLGYDSNGVVTEVRWVLRDVTDARRAQQAMQERFVATTQEAEALREADRWKDVFLSAAAHDLRGPLAIIEGASDTLLHARDLAIADREALTRTISRSSGRLQRLLDDLLDLDRFARGGVTPDRSDVAVRTLVTEVIESMVITSHAVTVLGPDVTARLDATRVEQVVTNLVGNAIAHTPAGTPIDVCVAASERGVTLTVEDAGPGVPADLGDDAFQPFVTRRVHREDRAGTGLGLSLVRLFAQLHGGDAWHEPRPGGGARFVVELPGPT